MGQVKELVVEVWFAQCISYMGQVKELVVEVWSAQCIRYVGYICSHIWNNLPQDSRHSATSFKSQHKTFLFSEYFS